VACRLGDVVSMLCTVEGMSSSCELQTAHHDLFAVLQQEVRLAGVDDDDAAHQDPLQPQRLWHLRLHDVVAATNSIST
jgi:hypothetical protein